MQSLVTILKEQVNVYQKLLDLARNKQQVLISNDIQKLEQLNKDEQKVIMQTVQLENKRLQILNTLTEVFGTNVESYTLKELAEKAPEPFQGDLNQVYIELNGIIEELDKVNQENSILIEQALKIVNFTLNTITQSEREVVYGEKDSKKVRPASNILDAKA